MPHELPPLPYAADALEPHISAETIEYHYGKHHRAYVDALNRLVEGTEFADSALESIVSQAGSGPIYNNAGQVLNHSLYWQCMGPAGGGRPKGEIADAIQATFGSFEKFREHFTGTAMKLFGSGWVWLVKTGDGTLNVEATKDAVNPLGYGRVTLMTCDVWEHAYYIDYRNDKGAYLENFWQVVDWDFVNIRLREL